MASQDRILRRGNLNHQASLLINSTPRAAVNPRFLIMKYETISTIRIALIMESDRMRANWVAARDNQCLSQDTRRSLMDHWRNRYIDIRKARAEFNKEVF